MGDFRRRKASAHDQAANEGLGGLSRAHAWDTVGSVPELLLFLLVGVGLGAGFAWALGHQRRKALAAAEQRLELELSRAKAEGKVLARRLEVRSEQLARTAAQRDDYAKIASTHELRPFRWAAPQWVRKVWKDRRYAGHPASNLEGLTRDFATFRDEHVLVKLDIELLGGWKRLFGGEHESAVGDVTRSLSAGESMMFEGPADRVLEQVVTFIRDDDTGFVTKPDDGEVAWRDPDSPMTWLLTVDVLEGQASPPEVCYVEVLRVQEQLVERVVEVAPEVAARLRDHEPAQLVALVDVRELGRSERRRLESAALLSALEAVAREEAREAAANELPAAAAVHEQAPDAAAPPTRAVELEGPRT